MIKFNSVPETEPIYTILKARSINTSKIKDKEERKYWNELKRIHKIPQIYIDDEELNAIIEKEANKYGKSINRTNV